MWLGKFLDFEEDVKTLKSKIKDEVFYNLKRSKITPLEFTIIENIFNCIQLSGYDLIKNLNKHFAGTWEAQSGTVYPILSKLEKDGFLKAEKVKSPIGPLRKVYSLTQVGEELLKHKVNKNYLDQLKFIENFLVELSSIYVHSFPDEERVEKIEEIRNVLEETLKNIMDVIPVVLEFKTMCFKCGTEMGRDVTYCPNCGVSLFNKINDK